VGAAFALGAACGGEDDKPFSPGEGSGASSGTTSTGGNTSIGAGGDPGDGGNEPAPMFDLPCGAQKCAQGQICCLEGDTCQQDPLLCMGGAAIACNDPDDCNADGGTPEVCCAVFTGAPGALTFTASECTSKGGCSGPGRTRVCTSTAYCDDCAPVAGLPSGWQVCGPPP
jgi:hypothetical protein